MGNDVKNKSKKGITERVNKELVHVLEEGRALQNVLDTDEIKKLLITTIKNLFS